MNPLKGDHHESIGNTTKSSWRRRCLGVCITLAASVGAVGVAGATGPGDEGDGGQRSSNVCPGSHLGTEAGAQAGAWGELTPVEDGVEYSIAAGATVELCVFGGGEATVATLTGATSGTLRTAVNASGSPADLSHWSYTVVGGVAETPEPVSPEPTTPEPDVSGSADVCAGTHLGADAATESGAWGELTPVEDGVEYSIAAGATVELCVFGGGEATVATLTGATSGTLRTAVNASGSPADLSHWSYTVVGGVAETPEPVSPEPTTPEPDVSGSADVCAGTHLGADAATESGAWGELTPVEDGVEYSIAAGATVELCVFGGGEATVATLTGATSGTLRTAVNASGSPAELSHWSYAVLAQSSTAPGPDDEEACAGTQLAANTGAKSGTWGTLTPIDVGVSYSLNAGATLELCVLGATGAVVQTLSGPLEGTVYTALAADGEPATLVHWSFTVLAEAAPAGPSTTILVGQAGPVATPAPAGPAVAPTGGQNDVGQAGAVTGELPSTGTSSNVLAAAAATLLALGWGLVRLGRRRVIS